jgi:hypothetical protein
MGFQKPDPYSMMVRPLSTDDPVGSEVTEG